ncbi:TolC family protein [Chloroherpeton thalassium]|uniref:TolC family protein n=1 Tax=Chloroherpeton thalassium TaxID=100716 RepID=UPI0002E24A30|nr:TolC family protein [Chloroherpeton thalassium]
MYQKHVKQKAWLLAFVLVVCCGFSPVYAQDGATRKLTLSEALELAKSKNHQVTIARHQLEKAEAQSLESWSGFLPKVTVSETFVRSNDPVAVFGAKLRQGIFNMGDFSGPGGTSLTNYMDPNLPLLNDPNEINNFNTAIEVQQPLLNLDAIWGKSAAAAAAEGYEFSLKRTEEAIALGVEKAYFGMVLAKQKLVAIEKALEAIQAYANEAKASFEKGLITEADLLAAQVRLSELQDQKMVAENDIRNASDMLRFLLRIEENVTIEPTDDLIVATNLPQVNSDNAPMDRSDIKALESFEHAASRKETMECLGWMPRLNAFGRYDWNGDEVLGSDGENWTIGVSLQWNIFDGLGRLGRVRQASADAQEMRVKYEEAKEQGLVDVRKAFRNLLSAKDRVEIAEKSVSQAEASYKISSQRFAEGLQRPSEMLTSEASLTNSRLRLLKAKYDFRIAASDLRFYSGNYAGAENLEK